MMVTVGLMVRVEARSGMESEVESFLTEALALAEEEPDTVAWVATRLGQSTFGIFDVFPDDSGRRAHLAGPITEALSERADDLLAEPPTIEHLDILAHKLPE